MSIILKENDARQVIVEPLTIDDFSETLISDLKNEVDTTWIWEQTSPAQQWVIPHGLHKYPEVTVISSSEVLVHGAVKYIDDMTLTIDFISALAGKALLN